VAFPGHHPGPRKWLKFVAGILETGRGYLSIAAKPTTKPQDAAKLIQTAEQFGGYAYEFLQYVAGADATQIPHQVVAPFQRWVDRLGITNTIFFRAEHLPNYELWWLDARNFSAAAHATTGLTKATTAISWPVLRVTVPGHAMGMLPHYAVVGHELGHAIQERLKPDFTPNQKDQSDCYDRIETRLKANNMTFGSAERVRIKEIVDNWVDELKADAVGHALSGPAFFFALCGFLELAGQGYGIGHTHPPTDLRRELLIQHLSAGASNFINVFQAKTGLKIDDAVNSPHVRRCPPPDALFTELCKAQPKVDAAICVELIAYARVVAPAIFAAADAYLKTNCPELVYTPEQLQIDLGEPLDLLCVLVPPIEYRDANGVHPTALASILNIGWAALLTRLDRMDDPSGQFGDPTARKMERCHELLLKAVELSEARRLWEECK